MFIRKINVNLALEIFEELHYAIYLKRKSNYYIYVLFLPTFIVSTLSICGLFTPTNNVGTRAEKVVSEDYSTPHL